MHPKEAHMAIVAAIAEFEREDAVETPNLRTKPTKQDLADKLQRMNERELTDTLKNLSRKGRENIRIVNRIKVPYCCKPVAVYGLYAGDQPKNMLQWHESMSLWAGFSQ
jgi:hypothetical protein